MNIEDLKGFAGFGVAGNFAHHLEQAGEMVDFVDVKTEEENAPKGIFPFYLPNFDTFLSLFPLSCREIVAPDSDSNLQMEPEVALLCDVIYDGDKVVDVVPNEFCAYNDCSIRRPDAKKISEKKNWGSNSKGISAQTIKIDKFEDGGVMDSYHIASFLRRDNIVYEYGKDSPVTTYNYFYTKLREWIVNKLNTQDDFGPLENLSSYIQKIDKPSRLVISIGATSYTEFGESTYLQNGDEIYVCVYDSKEYSYDDIVDMVSKNDIENKSSISILHQSIK
jgi:hypothetical protein